MLTSLRLILVFIYVPPPNREGNEVRIGTDTAHGEEHGSLGTSFNHTRDPFIVRLMFPTVNLFYSKNIFLCYKCRVLYPRYAVKSFKSNGNSRRPL